MIGRDHKLDGINLICHWQTNDPVREIQVISFWDEMNVLPEGTDRKERVKQVAYCSITDEGRLVAVSTAYPAKCPYIEKDMLFIRYLVHPDFRQEGVGGRIWLATVDHLMAQAVDGELMGCKGIASVTVNPTFQASFTYAVLPNSGMIYIGSSENGHPIRIRYFDDATIN